MCQILRGTSKISAARPCAWCWPIHPSGPASKRIPNIRFRADKTRKIWLICIGAMHAGIGVTMGMYLFALMIVLNVAAFGPGVIRAESERISLRPQEVVS